MGMMSEITTSSKEPKGREALFLQDAERNAAYFGSFKPGYFMYIGPASEKTWNFEKYPDDPKGKLDELANRVTEVYLGQKRPLLKGCIDFQKGELKKGGTNMHFSAGDSAVKKRIDLISSANDFCIVFRNFSVFLERLMRSTLKVDEIRLQLFVTQKSLGERHSVSTLCS